MESLRTYIYSFYNQNGLKFFDHPTTTIYSNKCNHNWKNSIVNNFSTLIYISIVLPEWFKMFQPSWYYNLLKKQQKTRKITKIKTVFFWFGFIKSLINQQKTKFENQIWFIHFVLEQSKSHYLGGQVQSFKIFINNCVVDTFANNVS